MSVVSGWGHTFDLPSALTRGVGESAALVIDLDDFKQINDSLGHAAGDVVLKEVGRRVRASVRGIDFAGRVGGDEFMLILPDTDPAEVTRQHAQYLGRPCGDCRRARRAATA